MKTNNKTLNQGGVTVYETPTLTALDCQGEGLLCVSIPGSSIEPGTEEDWGTL